MPHEKDAAVSFFAEFIEKELGIVYSEFNYFQLHNRLEEITKMRQLKSIDELLTIARAGMPLDLKQLVLDVATNNETSFFRDAKLFQSIRNVIVPELIDGRAGQPLRVWSAACSTGQEPYTLAMILQETKEALSAKFDFEIVASDISSRVLARAETAKYSQLEVQRGLPSNLMIKYFEKDATDYWTVQPQLRNRVKFQKLNLLQPFSQMGAFDLILCRNVLIYQDVENKKRIISKMVSLMGPRSYLVLGSGESMIGLSEDFESVRIGDALVYRLKRASQTLSA